MSANSVSRVSTIRRVQMKDGGGAISRDGGYALFLLRDVPSRYTAVTSSRKISMSTDIAEPSPKFQAMNDAW